MNPNIGEAGKATQYTSTKRPKNPGRKPSMIKRFIKDNAVSMGDQIAIFEEVIGNYDAAQITQMVQTKVDPKGKPLSGLVWGFLVAWLADIKRGWSAGGINIYMRDRRFGKTPDKLITLNEDLTQLDPAERRQRIDELYTDFKNNQDQLRGSGDATPGSVDGVAGEPEETDKAESGTVEKKDN